MEFLVFDSDTFYKEVDLTGSIFKATTFFGCTFEEWALFPDCKFFGASFLGSTFKEDAIFDNAFFDGDVDFQIANFRKYIFLSDVKFSGRVRLARTQFKDLIVSWQQLEGHLEYFPPANIKLMKYFDEQRLLDDADGVYLFSKDYERMNKPWYVRYPEYWFIQLTCGYGRRPLNTFILSIILVILFAVFFTNSKAIKEIEKESGRRWLPRLYREVPKTRRKRFYYALYFSLHTFIIGVVSDWHASDEFFIKVKRIRLFRFRTLSMIEGALGWILVIILIISLERTIGR